MGTKPEKQYKPIDNAFTREIQSDLEANMEKFRDPVVLGEMVFRLLEERENTNRILKNVMARLDAMEAKYGALPEAPEQPGVIEQPMLPEIDEQILAFVKESGKATARDVQKRFKYKGKNAASARLNRLCAMNLLQKRQVGKKVFFFSI